MSLTPSSYPSLYSSPSLRKTHQTNQNPSLFITQSSFISAKSLFLSSTPTSLCNTHVAKRRYLALRASTARREGEGKGEKEKYETYKVEMEQPKVASSSWRKYETRHRDPNPKTAALLVIDMQNYFSSMAKPILHQTLTTIDLCRRASIPVFFTRHVHKSPTDHGMLGEWCNGDLILDGTTDSQIIPEISRKINGHEEIEDKSTYSAFQNTRLQEKLENIGVEEVIVIGVMTNICCETTAREAFIKGYRVFFSTDATATLNEELHEATLMNIAFGFAYLFDCDKLRQGLLGGNGN